MAGEIISREDARAQGLARFYTGAPCKFGHDAGRQVAGGMCCECNRLKARARYQPHPREAKSSEEIKARRAAWYQANKERTRPAKLARYVERREERIAYTAAWCKANPEKAREFSRMGRRRRRARQKGSLETHTAADLAEIFAAQRGRCAYCPANLKRVKKHVDHIIPLARGGSNGRANLQYLCQRCNQTKNWKDPIDFAQSIGLLL